MRTRWLGARRVDLDECGSTNDEAARLARAGAGHGTVVIAVAQRAGRGRTGRAWSSPRGLGVYLSALLRSPMTTALALADVPPITLAIGIGLCDALRAHGAPATLKWPNDALVHRRKIAGVLVEAQSQGARLESIVVGIGVNLAAGEGGLPAEIADTATTLELAAGRPVDREAFIDTLLAQVERWIDRYVAVGLPAVIPAWQERMAPDLAARAVVDGVPVVGHLVGLADDGAVLLRDDRGGVHPIRSGDVEVVKPAPDGVSLAEPALAP